MDEVQFLIVLSNLTIVFLPILYQIRVFFGNKTMTYHMNGNPLEFGTKNSKSGKVVSLKHPRSLASAKFLIIDDMLHEIVQFDQKKTIFIDSTCRSDGKLYFSSPIDPIFLVLPYLKRVTQDEDAVSLDQLLKDPAYPNLAELGDCFKYLKFACDQDENGNFQYNEEKLLRWLDKKYDQVHQILKMKKVKEESLDKEAKGVLAQYLSNDILKIFIAHRDGTDKRKSVTSLMSDTNKKRKISVYFCSLNYLLQ